jgi:lincosamide nucleotidyltransferase A/C/D/E
VNRQDRLMSPDQVLDVVDRLASEHITAWIDGGWGVDALLGRQTREHSDLDLVVDADAVHRVRRLLLEEGFEVIRDWLPTAIAFAHDDGREVDLHPIALTSDGGGDQIQLDGRTRWHYDAPVTGEIGGRSVLCCSVDTQIRSHLGYEPGETDHSDMRALATRFDRGLPPPYTEIVERP